MDQEAQRPVTSARFACLSCRKSKRKCDRSLPICALCQKNRATCQYRNKHRGSSTQLQTPPSAGLTTGFASIGLLTAPSSVTPKFPVVYFLNRNIFRQAGLELPLLDLPIPKLVLDILDHADNLRSLISDFFDTIHDFFPILSKARFSSHVLNPLLPMRCEKAFLVLSMRLVTLRPSDQPQMCSAPEYIVAKQFHTDLMAAGARSIYFVQASILFCLYEFGHAIYPAAYFSIAAVARNGIASDMDRLEKTQVDPSKWIDQEEVRRAWWAIFILDRCVNLGSPTRPLATPEPSTSSVVPVDDSLWESGVAPNEHAYALTPYTCSIGRFGRFAESGCLLGRAFRHIADRTVSTVAIKSEAEQLRRTLRSLVELVDHEAGANACPMKLNHCTTTAVCYSALQILQTAYSSQIADLSDGQADLRATSLEAVANEGVKMSKKFLDHLPNAPLHRISPFLLHFLHHCALFYIDRPAPDDDDRQAVLVLKDLLRVIGSKWKAADVYLEMTEAYEAMKRT